MQPTPENFYLRYLFIIGVFTIFTMKSHHASANTATNSNPSLAVVIDPGHGGMDNGATRGEMKESQICLHISQFLAELLRKNPDFKVSLTRETDEQVSLSDRVELSRRIKADVFVSIHANASADPKAFGMELYFQNQLPPDEESLFLANAENQNLLNVKNSKHEKLSSQNDIDNVVEDLKRNQKISESFQLTENIFKSLSRTSFGKVKNHAVRQAPFYVLSQNNIPAVLIEVGYITSDSDKTKLASADHQKKIANQIYEGLLKHKASLDQKKLERSL